MKTQTIIRSCVTALGVLVATACGDSGPAYEDELDGEVAQDAGIGAYYTLQGAFAGMDFGYPNVGVGAPPALTALAAARGTPFHRIPRWTFDPRDPAAARDQLQAAIADGCTVSSSGTDGDIWEPFDGNENGIADDWTVEVTCVISDEPSEGVTRVETTKNGMRVKEHSSGLYGFDASSHYSSHEVSSNGDDEYWGIELVHNVTVTADGATSKTKVHQWEKYRDEGEWTEDLEGFFDADLTFDPDGTITGGDDASFPDGSLTIEGSFRLLDAERGNFSFDLETPVPWQYRAECAHGVEEQRFVDGYLLGLLNGDEDQGFSILWNECGAGYHVGVFGDDVVILPPESR